MALPFAVTPRRLLLLIAAPVLGLLVVIGAVSNRNAENHAHPGGSTSPAGVVDFTGLGTVKFGATTSELTREHGMSRRPGDCGATFSDAPQVSPVFVDDKLALLWVSAPVHTPEGITVGSPVTAVRSAYPQAVELPPPHSYQYPGLLVTKDDRAYLFLYSGDTVRKMIVGYTSYARDLYATGGDTC